MEGVFEAGRERDERARNGCCEPWLGSPLGSLFWRCFWGFGNDSWGFSACGEVVKARS